MQSNLRLQRLFKVKKKIDASKWHLHKNPKINDANVIKLDVVADNGVIHVIDKVLLPK